MKKSRKRARRINASTNPLDIRTRGSFSSSLSRLIERAPDATRKIQEIARDVNCLFCGSCCKGPVLFFVFDDSPSSAAIKQHVERLRVDNVSRADDYDALLVKSDRGCRLLRTGTNLCSIYSIRPPTCIEYPFEIAAAFAGTDRQINYTALSSSCPPLTELADQRVNTVFASDLVFPIKEALEHPEKYVPTKLVDAFIRELRSLLEQRKTYYVTPFLGTSLQAVLNTYRARRMPYSKMPDSPLLTVNGEIVFPIGQFPDSAFTD